MKLNDDRFRGEPRIGTCWLEQVRLEPHLPMPNNREDNQEHQQNIDQRDHMDIGQDPALTTESSKAMSHLAVKELTLRGVFSHGARKATKDELLASLELGGDEADFIDASFVHDVNGVSHIHEKNVVIALDESDFLGTILENLFHARAELVPVGVLVVDFQFAALGNLDDDRFVLEFHALLLVRRRLRHEGIESLRRKGRDHHKNDDEHKQNVDERNDIRRGQCTVTFSNFHPHCEFSYRAEVAGWGAAGRAGWEPTRLLSQQTNETNGRNEINSQSPYFFSWD
jgi:hypothetical protein